MTISLKPNNKEGNYEKFMKANRGGMELSIGVEQDTHTQARTHTH